MSTFKRFEDIISWKEARELNRKIGRLISDKRFQNNFRLINQIEGSAGSIMDNIAEGYERSGNKEFIQFLYIAKGSCGELRSQLCRAFDRNYIVAEEFSALSEHAQRISFLIQKLINYLNNSPMKGYKYKSTSVNSVASDTEELYELDSDSPASETIETFKHEN